MAKTRLRRPGTRRPLVAVTGDVREQDNYRWHAAPDAYLSPLATVAGVAPVIVPALGGLLDLDGLLDSVHGVVCTGSRSNVHPSLYGAEPSPAFEPYDRDRDATALPLIHKALSAGIPLFCICRGMQELNVALGGTLATEIQTLPGRMDHRAPDAEAQADRFALAHAVSVTAGGCLGRVLQKDEVRVNSLHRQAIGRLADRLAVEAIAPDGTIEAVSVKDAAGYAVGVQWHPEFWAETDRPSRRLFEAFGKAVHAHGEGRLLPLSAL
ncbi:MAG: gamma-glutamyl-gamma-aminobutyrate hydrolase family protein [Flavobacteriaceae bacterium]